MILVVFYQNQAVFDSDPILYLNPNDLEISDSSTYSYSSSLDISLGDVVDLQTQRRHELKIQGNGRPPRVVRSRSPESSYIDFLISGRRRQRFSDRSEIRMVGTKSDFGQIYYSGFTFMIPESSDPIENDHLANRVANDWALIWQCPQAVPSGTAVSPPLSLHIENNTLSVKTIQDYQPWSNGSPRQDVQNILRLQRNRWYTVLLRYSLGERGSYSIWINGRKINTLSTSYNSRILTDTKYLPIGYRDLSIQRQQYCSVRYGLYKNSSRGKFSVRFKNVTFSEVYHRPQDVPAISRNL